MTDDLIGLAPRPVELDDRALGVLATGDTDTSRFMDLLIAKLEKRHFLTAVVRVDSPGSTPSNPEQMAEQLAAQCDVVVAGVFDSVETVTGMALGAATFERLGVPCAVLVTSDVAAASRQALAVHGLPDGTSVVSLDLGPDSDPVSPQALVDHCYRAVEAALTASEDPRRLAAPSGGTQRNGEVTCEC